MRSNQLAAWAEMARAIAHEIKNPLTPIQLSAEHLRRLLRDRGVLPSPQIEACLETIVKQVRALHEIAGEFSAYAKLPLLAPEPTDPAEFMRAVVAPYRSRTPPGIVIEERYAAVPPIAADRPRVLARAIVNLIENALQAMPAGRHADARRPRERRGTAGSCCRWPTPGRGSTRRCAGGCSSPTSRPSPRARAWAWPSCGARSRPTAGASTSRARRGAARPSASTSRESRAS